jgi:hypothetical protein
MIKMRIALLVWISLLLGATLKAQVTLNLQVPLSGLRLKSQLWSIALVNAAPENQNVQLEMTLTDVSTNQRILTGVTCFFSLPPGMKQLQPGDIMPVRYHVVASGYNMDNSPEGFLPVGIFTVCYTLSKINGDAVQAVAEACEPIEVEPLSTLQLILPADSEYVESARPVFSWTPLLPSNLFNSLTYDWVVVEVYPSQSAKEAIEQNVPLVKQLSIPSTHLQYSQASPPLDASKVYAWGVVAKNNINPVSSSETRTFRVKPNPQTASGNADYDAKLNRQEDASFVICNGLLRYEYRNEINDSVVTVSVFDITGSLHEAVKLEKEEAVLFGQNRLQMNVGASRRFKDKHVYLLQLTNSQKEKWYLKFEYRKKD